MEVKWQRLTTTMNNSCKDSGTIQTQYSNRSFMSMSAYVYSGVVSLLGYLVPFNNVKVDESPLYCTEPNHPVVCKFTINYCNITADQSFDCSVVFLNNWVNSDILYPSASWAEAGCWWWWHEWSPPLFDTCKKKRMESLLIIRISQ